MATEWADREAMKRSYELVAREVIPHFQGSSEAPITARDWAAEHRETLIGGAGAAVMQAITDHHAERGARD
jgi:limonene 1,2-monooxygenase